MKTIKSLLIYLSPAFLALFFSTCNTSIVPSEEINTHPSITPDYADIVIPPNIAPLNFTILEAGNSFHVEISAEKGKKILIRQQSPKIQIPIKKWHKLLEKNTGGELYIDVYVKNGGWKKYKTIRDSIARDRIDNYLVYRLINGAYITWDKMGIYQRNLENFIQYTIYENTSTDKSCVNCHMFSRNNPEKMQLHFRASHGGTMILDGTELKKINTKTDQTIGACGYPSWHPEGNFIAYSINEVRQVFTSDKTKTQDVFDISSDIAVYDVKANTLFSSHRLTTSSRENLPTWSPDGKWIYFISAPGITPDKENKTRVKYDLLRISFDANTRTFGRIDTVLSSKEVGRSITFPVVSPDGRYLLFGATDYGYFPVYHAVSDIYLLEIATGKYHALNSNSSSTDSYHSWAFSGRWFVFSSKRLDDTYSRPFFAYFDENGKTHKPFVMPQKDPAFYESYMVNFNRPEFVTGRIQLNPREVRDLVLSDAENVVYRSYEASPAFDSDTLEYMPDENETEYSMH